MLRESIQVKNNVWIVYLKTIHSNAN